MTTLALNNVSKSFGGVHAVRDLSMEIAEGRITGLIGPNGAGKSTVVNLVSGIFSPSSGQLTIDGQDISGMAPDRVARRGVSRTFQNIRLFAQASVLENVLVGFHRHEHSGIVAGMLGLPSSRRERASIEERARALLLRFGMQRFADVPAGDLSYGHQRRVEMMRALACDPRFLLLDEPIAGMNDVEAAELGEIYREIARDGVGVLLIEHNVGFVGEVCDTVCVLDLGRLIASGNVAETLANQKVVEAYLGG